MKYQLVVFVIMAGILTTLVRGYGFGVGNQLEQIPLVMRVLDRHYLTQDLVINSDSGYSARWFYSRVLAGLSMIVGLPVAFLTTTVIANMGVLAATGLLASEIFGRNRWKVYSAMVAVASWESIVIGGAGQLVSGLLTPQLLAMPLALWSVVLAIRGRPIFAAGAAGVAGLVHPQVGLLVGGLALASGKFSWKAWLVMSCFVGIWVPQLVTHTNQTTQEFVRDYVYFRSPHHNVPSTWPKQDFAMFVAFMVGLGWALKLTQRRLGLDRMVAMILVLFLLGYVFVELWPVRMVVNLQVWRLVFLLKWLGLVMVAGTVVGRWGWGWVWLLVGGWQFNLREWGLGGALVIIAWFLGRRKWWILGVGIFVWIVGMPRFRPQWKLEQLVGPKYEIARAVQKIIVPGETILAPIDFGHVRFMGQAALIAEWKADPYNDKTRKEWKRRVVEIFGDDPRLFDQRYRSLGDDDVQKLADEYSFRYAILYVETKSNFKVVYRNEELKLVQVDRSEKL